jgi:hypothetical protein
MQRVSIPGVDHQFFSHLQTVGDCVFAAGYRRLVELTPQGIGQSWPLPSRYSGLDLLSFSPELADDDEVVGFDYVFWHKDLSCGSVLQVKVGENGSTVEKHVTLRRRVSRDSTSVLPIETILEGGDLDRFYALSGIQAEDCGKRFPYDTSSSLGPYWKIHSIQPATSQDGDSKLAILVSNYFNNCSFGLRNLVRTATYFLLYDESNGKPLHAPVELALDRYGFNADYPPTLVVRDDRYVVAVDTQLVCIDSSSEALQLTITTTGTYGPRIGGRIALTSTHLWHNLGGVSSGIRCYEL